MAQTAQSARELPRCGTTCRSRGGLALPVFALFLGGANPLGEPSAVWTCNPELKHAELCKPVLYAARVSEHGGVSVPDRFTVRFRR
jgi:hypothetical protein